MSDFAYVSMVTFAVNSYFNLFILTGQQYGIIEGETLYYAFTVNCCFAISVQH